jgi:predicted RNase H-like HicB family nuclease
MKGYTARYEQASDGGWSAYSPDVPGAFAHGDPREEAEKRLVDAVGLQLIELRRRRLPLPRPRDLIPLTLTRADGGD